MPEESQEPLLNTIIRFGQFLLRYFSRFLVIFGQFASSIIQKLIYAVNRLNHFLVFRLMWHRGRLSRPLGHLGIVIVTMMVLLVSSFMKSSNVFSDTNLAAIISENQQSKNISEDFLINSALVVTNIPEGRSEDEIKTYAVKSGDTLFQIAEDHHITVDTLLAVNGLGVAPELLLRE